jgi:transposase-like protein
VRPARRRYPDELRQRAVELVFETIEQRDGVRYGVVPRVARQLDVRPESLRYWVRRAETDGTWRPLSPPAPVVQATEPEPAATRRPLAALRVPLALYVASRLVVLAVLIAAAHQPHAGLAARPRSRLWPAIPHSSHLLGTFATWDAAWYVRLAGHSYNPVHLSLTPFNKDVAFFPLFPMLIRAAMLVTGAGAVGAGVVVTFVTGALATVAVWWAARHLVGAAAANAVVAIWCFFPGAFVFSLVYSEGVTIACAAACLVLLLRRHWLLAGLAAAAATATQPAALVLVLCCAWEALVAVRSRREWGALVAPVVAPLGALGYFAYLWAHTGTPSAWFAVERKFWAHRRLGPRWTVVQPVIHLAHHPASVDDGIRMAGLVLVLAGTYLLWRWRPPAVFSIWAVGTVFVALMSAPVGTRPRFLLVAFPLLFALARRLPRPALYAIAAVEAPLLGLLTFVMVTTLRTVP